MRFVKIFAIAFLSVSVFVGLRARQKIIQKRKTEIMEALNQEDMPALNELAEKYGLIYFEDDDRYGDQRARKEAGKEQ